MGQAKGIELDKQCIGMCATDTTNTYSPNVQLVQDQQTGMPFEWRKGTLLTADEAVMNHRQVRDAPTAQGARIDPARMHLSIFIPLA